MLETMDRIRDGALSKPEKNRTASGENPFYRLCLTLPLNREALKNAGADPGPDGPLLTADPERIMAVCEEFDRFNREECCGKCVPCREGVRHILELLHRLASGEKQDGDVELLLELADAIYSTALCPLGKTAASRIAGVFEGCPEEYLPGREGVREARRSYRIDPALCRGCSRCARGCPTGAITGKIREAFEINPEKCVGCGACLATCAFKAVKEAS